MLFSIGSKVKLVRTGDEGVVKAMLDNGMVLVYLTDDDMEIPVFPEDLQRMADPAGPFAPIKAKVVPAKQVREPVRPDPPTPEMQYTILKPTGIQLAFEPVLRNDASPEKYRIYILNDTAATFLYMFQLHVQGQLAWETRGKLGPASFIDTGYLHFEQLHDGPEADLQCWRILDTGTAPRLHRRLKLKPASLFKRLATAPLLNRVAHLMKVFERLDAKPPKPPTDLRAYTKSLQRTQAPRGWSNLTELPHEVWALATFQHEIDLHLENLVAQPAKVPAADILRTQLSHFENYLHQAIRVGAERVFIIHGVGEGKLRDAIAKRLAQYPEVVSFKNEYHPKYGWGATEVIFYEGAMG